MERHLDYPAIPYHALLSRAARRYETRPAIIFEDRRVSYGDLDRDASRFAHALLGLGMQKGERLAIYTPNCPEYEVAFFGASRAGLVPSPLNPSYKEREVSYQLNESGASVLVAHASLLPIVEAARADVPSLRQVIVVGADFGSGVITLESLLDAQPMTPPDVEIASADLAALPFSSGTTGRSKGVMLTHGNLVANALQFVEATASTDRDVLLIYLPLYHIYGVALMSTAIASGATQVLLPRFNLDQVVDAVQKYGVTEFFAVPPVMLALANAPGLRKEQFRSVRFIKNAAAPLAPDIARRVGSRLGVRVIQAYGLTESSPLTHMVPLDEDGYDGSHVGVVAADTRYGIVDLDTGDRDLVSGEVGEIVVAGPQVMMGYWNAPEETAHALRNGWLYTGDVGRVDETGRLFIVDRKKEMIKYRAWSIAPAELEALLLEHSDVADCAVVAQPDPESGEVPRAFVVLREGACSSPDDLQRFVADRVASYKQIRRVDIVDAIPRTPSGKILRRVLKEQLGS